MSTISKIAFFSNLILLLAILYFLTKITAFVGVIGSALTLISVPIILILWGVYHSLKVLIGSRKGFFGALPWTQKGLLFIPFLNLTIVLILLVGLLR